MRGTTTLSLASNSFFPNAAADIDLSTNRCDSNNGTDTSIYCLSSQMFAYDSFDFLSKNGVPSRFLERLLGELGHFDDSTWMVWTKQTSSAILTNDISSSRKSTNNQILLQNGSVADLLLEFDTQWLIFLKHSYITTEQSNYT